MFNPTDFKADDKQLVPAKDDKQLVPANDNKQTSTNGNNHNGESQGMALAKTGITVFGGAAKHASKAWVARQETLQEESKAKAKIAADMIASINNFTVQIKNLVDGQNEIIKQASDNFTNKISKGLDLTTPDKIAELRKARLEGDRVYLSLMAASDKMLESGEIDKYTQLLDKAIQKEASVDNALKEQSESYANLLKSSQEEFRKLMETMVKSNNEVVLKAIELQEKMVKLFQDVVEVTFKGSSKQIEQKKPAASAPKP